MDRRLAAIMATLLVVAGCGATGPGPVGAATPPAASNRPATSHEPSADPATSAIAAFIAFASKRDATYQATFTGQSRHTVDILPITKGLLQVNGRDVLVRATFTFKGGAKDTVEHRSVGGKAWLREVPHAWQRLSGFGAAQSMAAFPAVRGPADVTYLGPTTVGGKTLYKVQMASAIVNPVMIPASNLTEVVVTDPELTVLIDASGRPVSGTALIIGRGRVSRQLQEIAIDLDVSFTKVGQPVTIAAP